MALPTISENDREIVLLSGFERAENARKIQTSALVIVDEDDLRRSINNDNDAVAFGYVAGRWVAVA